MFIKLTPREKKHLKGFYVRLIKKGDDENSLHMAIFRRIIKKLGG